MQNQAVKPLRLTASKRSCDGLLRSILAIPSIFGQTRGVATDTRSSRSSNTRYKKEHERRPREGTSLSKVPEPVSEIIHPGLKSSDVASSSVDAAARRELRWLPDPIVFQQRVTRALQEGKIPLALSLLRLASKEKNVVSGWNTAVDYFASKGETANAIKVYNEMKKRAQTPDARTYTLLLRGLAQNSDQKNAASRAVSIYHSITAPNSKITPNIIHTNAALEVCAKAGDMDALWGIVGRIPEEGAMAADKITYTTILKALRLAAMDVQESGLEGDETINVEHPREVAVARGRSMWFLIADRWRELNLEMGEDLMTAMGQLLLISDQTSNWDDVLSLVNQVTGVPRLLRPALPLASRNTAVERRSPGAVSPLARLPPALGDGVLDPFIEFKITPKPEPEPSHVRRRRGQPTFSQIKPGNLTLSLILECCLQIDVRNPSSGAAAAGKAYWEVLTDQEKNGLQPDHVSLFAYLRILRRTRGSRESVELVSKYRREIGSQLKTFKIAMATCVRNSKSPRALGEASELYKVMLSELRKADVKVLQQYVLLVAAHVSDGRRSGILDAIRMVIAGQTTGRPLSSKDSSSDMSILTLARQSSSRLQKEDSDTVALVARKVIGLIDSVEEARTAPDLQTARAELMRVIETQKGDRFGRGSLRDAFKERGPPSKGVMSGRTRPREYKDRQGGMRNRSREAISV